MKEPLLGFGWPDHRHCRKGNKKRAQTLSGKPHTERTVFARLILRIFNDAVSTTLVTRMILGVREW
jgi:hypothetical protein